MTIIELRVTPPFERPTEPGVLARLTIPRMSSVGVPTIMARRHHAMDWMEHDPAAEWEGAKNCAVDSERALSLLAKLGAVCVALAAPDARGVHETTHQLTIYSGASSCVFAWFGDAPTGWLSLSEIAENVRALAEDLLKSV